jgi:hypothetical protein
LREVEFVEGVEEVEGVEGLNLPAEGREVEEFGHCWCLLLFTLN